MVWMQWPPSMEGRLCGPSKSYSSFTISPELDAEVVSVRPDKSVEKTEGKRGQFVASITICCLDAKSHRCLG